MAAVAIWFWICFSIVLYTFIGYGIILYLLVIFKRIFSPSIQFENSIFEPPVTLVVPCFNEGNSILNKIANCQLLDYPTDKLTLVFITDGSTDNSQLLLQQFPRIKVLHENRRAGKTAAENRAMKFVETPFVCMAPSSVWYTKQLPKDKWIELCNSIPYEVTIYLLGGSGDKILCEEIKNKSAHATIQILAGELSLLESCELMKHARMNYVNDSGPLHLASSVNAPTTAFFCSTVPSYGFYPLSYKSIVIEVSDLYCKPCGLHGYKTCPKNNFRCGNEIKLPLFK